MFPLKVLCRGIITPEVVATNHKSSRDPRTLVMQICFGGDEVGAATLLLL